MKDTFIPPSAGENPWKLALEGSGVGVWDWDLSTDQRDDSPRGWLMQGYLFARPVPSPPAPACL